MRGLERFLVRGILMRRGDFWFGWGWMYVCVGVGIGVGFKGFYEMDGMGYKLFLHVYTKQDFNLNVK